MTTSKSGAPDLAARLVGSWVLGVLDWFVMQNKRKEMPTQRKLLRDQGIMIKPLLVGPNNWVLLKKPKTREPNVVPIISRSQRRKIQRRYTKYQRDLKESGESTSVAQAKD